MINLPWGLGIASCSRCSNLSGCSVETCRLSFAADRWKYCRRHRGSPRSSSPGSASICGRCPCDPSCPISLNLVAFSEIGSRNLDNTLDHSCSFLCQVCCFKIYSTCVGSCWSCHRPDFGPSLDHPGHLLDDPRDQATLDDVHWHFPYEEWTSLNWRCSWQCSIDCSCFRC